MNLQWLHNYLVIVLGIPFVAEYILEIVISSNALARDFFYKKMIKIVENNNCWWLITPDHERAFFKNRSEYKSWNYFCKDNFYVEPDEGEVLLFEMYHLRIRVCDGKNWKIYESSIEDGIHYFAIDYSDTDPIPFCTEIKDLVTKWKGE